MDVKAILPTDRGYIPSAVKTETEFTTGSGVPTLQNKVEKTDKLDNQGNGEAGKQGETRQEQQVTEEELRPVTQEFNKLFQYLNTDIQFELHERTQRLMVQVVDTKTDKVLREFPPEELLDTIANIQEYVGVLLDKRV